MRRQKSMARGGSRQGRRCQLEQCSGGCGVEILRQIKLIEQNGIDGEIECITSQTSRV